MAVNYLALGQSWPANGSHETRAQLNDFFAFENSNKPNVENNNM